MLPHEFMNFRKSPSFILSVLYKTETQYFDRIFLGGVGSSHNKSLEPTAGRGDAHI